MASKEAVRRRGAALSIARQGRRAGAAPWAKVEAVWEALLGVAADLEKAEGCGLPGGAARALQLMLKAILENGPTGFGEGWRRAQRLPAGAVLDLGPAFLLQSLTNGQQCPPC